MILVIDNYDSFTFNLAQYLGELGQDLKVFRNDAITVDEIAGLKPERIVISPGPGRPENSGIIVETIQKLAGKIPILGVCLGHQDGETIFRGVENPFTATRYHSLVVSPASLPGCLEVSARTEDGVIMGLRHRVYPVEGVQFHPESILTTVGKSLLANFLSAARAPGGLTIDDCRI